MRMEDVDRMNTTTTSPAPAHQAAKPSPLTPPHPTPSNQLSGTHAYAHCEYDFFRRLAALGFETSVVVDVGGSNGAWSSVIAEVFPAARFELFEPLATVRADYADVLEAQRLRFANFRVHPAALGNRNGEADFWSEPHGVGSSLLVSAGPKSEWIRVPMWRLDDYRHAHAIGQPEVIKIDVQGGELMVLEGGPETVANADVLHIETWLARGYGKATPLLHELMDHLRPLGHVLVQLGEYWRRPDQELVVVDAFFAHRRLIDRLTERGGGYPWPSNWAPAS